MISTPKVVFDCNIFVQSLINLGGPAGQCFQKTRSGQLLLFVSPFVLGEIREIHLKTPSKYGITAEQTDALARTIASFAVVVSEVPDIYQHPHDRDDSNYINLALKADASVVVSRDRHLLMLADAARKEGRDFQSRFPELRVLDPLLNELSSQSTAGG